MVEKYKYKSNISIMDMLRKLDYLYEKEEELKKEINRLNLLFEQLQEEKEFLQIMIMFQDNKNKRIKQMQK